MGTQAASKRDVSPFNDEDSAASRLVKEEGLWYGLSSERTCLEGEELIRQGGSPHGVYVIARGHVKLSSIDQDGRELIVGLRSEGSMLGACAVILHRVYRISATAITECALRYLSAELFNRLLTDDVEFSRLVRLDQSRECYGLVTNIAQLGCASAVGRFEGLLRALISGMPLNEQRRGLRLELPLKHWEVAQLIAITPEHLSRIVRKMQQDGILEWKKSRITIFDPHRLQRQTNL